MSASSPAPLVSIVTATYNYSAVLRCAIESVLRQTLTAFEMLVVGDGCTDDSAEVVASFGDVRLRWYNLPENHGSQDKPNNLGIEHARGRYIAYLGHDDIWHPTHLEKLVALAEREEADFVNSLGVMIGPPGSGIRGLIGLAPGEGVPTSASLLSTSTLMHTRALVDQIGPWKDYRALRVAPQFEFCDRARAVARAAVLPELTVFKFPSVWRKNSYVEKSAREQQAHLERMATEPDFLERELTELAMAQALGKTSMSLMPRKPRVLPYGWHIAHYRRIRGLPARHIPRLTLRDYGEYAFSQIYKRLPTWLRLRYQWRRLRGKQATDRGDNATQSSHS